MEQSTGFVLSYVKYGDHDAVLSAFTAETGFETFFLKGIFSNKNRRKVFLQPLSELRFFTGKKNSSGITQATSIEAVRILADADVKSMAVIFFIAEFLSHALRSEAAQPKIYTAIQNLVTEISGENHSAHLFFLVNFLKYSGFAPLETDGEFLDPESGTFRDEAAGNYLGKEISTLWKLALGEENSVKKQVPAKLRAEFLDSILLYFRWHYTDFRMPKSLEVMRQLWR